MKSSTHNCDEICNHHTQDFKCDTKCDGFCTTTGRHSCSFDRGSNEQLRDVEARLQVALDRLLELVGEES